MNTNSNEFLKSFFLQKILENKKNKTKNKTLIHNTF